MQRKSWLTTAALVTGLAVGAVAGPSIQATVVSAQTTTTKGATFQSIFLDKLAGALGIQRTALDTAMTTASKAAATQAVQDGTMTQAQADALSGRIQSGDLGALGGGRGGFEGMRQTQQALIEGAAKALGITADELRTQLQSGQTLAQLATTYKTTEAAVTTAALDAAKTALDTAVKAGTITQAQADATYTQLQSQGSNLFAPRPFEGPGGRGGRGGHGDGPGGPAIGAVHQAVADAAAKTLGITADELRTQLRSGQTVAQLAAAHGTTEQAVTTAALSAGKTALDAAVKAGTITQAQADAAYTQLQAAGSGLFGPRGHGPKPAPAPAAPAPQAQPAVPSGSGV